MHDVVHEEDEVWLNVATNQQFEKDYGWGNWQQNSWTNQGDAYRSGYEYGFGYQDYDFGPSQRGYGTGVGSENYF